jgi:hypothetical protein
MTEENHLDTTAAVQEDLFIQTAIQTTQDSYLTSAISADAPATAASLQSEINLPMEAASPVRLHTNPVPTGQRVHQSLGLDGTTSGDNETTLNLSSFRHVKAWFVFLFLKC